MDAQSIFWIALILWIVLSSIYTDDTDKSFWKRSGMYHHIDYGTGCEYLAGGGTFGKKVLIPRLDKDGKHVCKLENIRK